MIAYLMELLGFGRKSWMLTFSGVQYYPANPHVDDVRIIDIAHHLSRICRYTGAINAEHYSVAEHSVHVSYCVPPEHAFAALMHDAPEAYTNDMSRPLKHSRLMWGYRLIEARNWLVIAKKFDLPYTLSPYVKHADIAVSRTEMAVLMPPLPAAGGYEHITPARVTIRALRPDHAKALFMERYDELNRGLMQDVFTTTVPLVRAAGMVA